MDFKMSRRGFIAGASALLAQPALPRMMGAAEAEAALQAFPNSISNPSGHYLDIVLSYLDNRTTDYIWRLERFLDQRLRIDIGANPSNAQRLYALVSHFARQTADLEFIAGFTDHTIREHYDELLHPRDWTGTTFEQNVFSRERFQLDKLLNEDGHRNDILRALRSKDDLRRHIDKTRAEMDEVVHYFTPLIDKPKMPLEADHVEIWYHDRSAFNLCLTEAYNDNTAGEVIDWRDPRSVNWLIESAHLQEFGSRLKQYELPSDIAGIMDNFEETKFFRYAQWWRQQHWARAAAPFRDASLGRLIDEQEGAAFQQAFRADIDTHNAYVSATRDYDRYEIHPFKSARQDLFDQAMNGYKTPAEKPGIPKSEQGPDYPVSCLFHSGEVSLVNTMDDEETYRLHVFGAPYAPEAMAVIRETLIRNFRAAAYVRVEENGDLLIAPHPLADAHSAHYDRQKLEGWASASKKAQLKEMIGWFKPKPA